MKDGQRGDDSAKTNHLRNVHNVKRWGASVSKKKLFRSQFLFNEKERKGRVPVDGRGNTFLHIFETEPGEMILSRLPREKAWIGYGFGHFGFRVKNLNDAVKELKLKGAEFLGGARDFRERVRVIHRKGPEDDPIEISERNPGFEALFRR